MTHSKGISRRDVIEVGRSARRPAGAPPRGPRRRPVVRRGRAGRVRPARRPGYLPIDRRAPDVNARGTYTVLSGSTCCPQVRAAMDAASRHYVQLKRAERRHRRAPGRPHRRRMGPRDQRLLRGAHPRDRGLRGGRQPRSARPDPAPLPASRGTRWSFPSTRATCTTRRCAPWACA